jgi:hypothetical protein
VARRRRSGPAATVDERNGNGAVFARSPHGGGAVARLGGSGAGAVGAGSVKPAADRAAVALAAVNAAEAWAEAGVTAAFEVEATVLPATISTSAAVSPARRCKVLR